MSQTNTLPNKKKRGGHRPNSGRKLGHRQKLSAMTLLAEIAKRDKPFAVGLAEDYHNARTSGDKNLIVKYQQMILNKVVGDKLDVTSGGMPLQPTFYFPSVELPEYQALAVQEIKNADQ